MNDLLHYVKNVKPGDKFSPASFASDELDYVRTELAARNFTLDSAGRLAYIDACWSCGGFGCDTCADSGWVLDLGPHGHKPFEQKEQHT